MTKTLNGQNVRHCTAGHNFFVIRSSGHIQRCWNHNNDIGHVIGCDFKPMPTTLCPRRVCSAACEPAEVTILEEECVQKGSAIRHIHDNPIQPQLEHMRFQMALTRFCNYKCQYCIAGSHLVTYNEELATRGAMNASEWVKWWDWIAAQGFKSVCVTVAGGEPTIYPGAIDVINSINQLNGRHNLCTNLTHQKIIDTMCEGDYSRWLISASVHPSNSGFDIDKFISNFRKVQAGSVGYICAVFVDARENAPYKDSILATLRSAGIECGILKDSRPGS